ncbi:MAG TPA: DUF4159 domain-containing protein [Planctomycetota bacterium]|jgi:hypothetical protein
MTKLHIPLVLLAVTLCAIAEEEVVDDGIKPPRKAAVAPGITTQNVQSSIEKGVAFLKQQQTSTGGWTYGNSYDTGATALVLLSLITAGVPTNDPVVQKGATYIVSRPNEVTYCTALTAMALGAIDPQKYKVNIQQAAEWLISAQTSTDMWTYGKQNIGGDASNTQIAVLGLWEAEKAGAKVPDKTWKRIENYYTRSQNVDGGWGYGHGRDTSYLSMSAAGIASLFIVQNRMYKPKRCGEFLTDKRLAAGLSWLTNGVGAGNDNGWNSNYAWYAVERAGILCRQKYFGNSDWYKLGCEKMLGQQTASGSFGGGQNADAVETAFALLFMAKGKKPLLVTKLHWGAPDAKPADADWNCNLYDVDNLVKHIGQELQTPYDWHSVRTSASVEELRYSPVLFITGHKAPKFSDEEIEKLREYMEKGGLIFAEACCGSAEFDAGFRAVIPRICANATLERLPPEHAVYRTHYQLGPNAQFLEGANWGCRTSVIYSPRGISCRWDGLCPGGSMGISRELAFQIGTNVVCFGMGEEPLKDRLESIAPDPVRKAKKAVEEPVIRGSLVWAQVQHKGDCSPDPNMWPKLLESLRSKLNLSVNAAKRPIPLSDASLRNYPLLYMVGHDAFRLSSEERAGLQRHLENGGMLLAESCCGRREFDRSFRELIAQVFPDGKLEPLSADHALLKTPNDVHAVTYRDALQKESPELKTPRLEILRLAAPANPSPLEGEGRRELFGRGTAAERGVRGTAAAKPSPASKGRIAAIYSQYALGCPIDGHPCGGCRGYSPADAFKIVSNIVMHALCGTAEIGGGSEPPPSASGGLAPGK